MSYKDIIPQLGLPDELNKRLESLLSMEKEKEEKGEGTYGPGFKALQAARKQFRKSYGKIRKYSPSKMPNKDDKSDSDVDLDHYISSSASGSSEPEDTTCPDDMVKRLPGTLTDEQKKGLEQEKQRLKFFEDKYLKKKLDFEKAIKDLENNEEIDEELLNSMIKDMDTEGYDIEAENDELDKIINELKEMSKDKSQETGKLDEIAD